MKRLWILELKKLLKKRMNIGVITVCLLLVGILFYLPVYQFIVLDTDGKQLTGTAAIAMNREFVNTCAGRLTDEKICADIVAYQALFHDPENVSKDTTKKTLTDRAYFKYILPYSDYWKLINGNYIAPCAYASSFSAVVNMDLENGIDFYSARDEKISTLLNQVYEDWNFSDSEKAFWLDRISTVTIPYEYGYHTGWEMLFSCLELFVIGMIGICICVSGTFSGEYQSGADSIILSSRYGKSKLLTAKILAAFAYSFFLFTLFLLVGCGILLTGFGTDGWDLPVQVLNTISPYDLSLAGAAVTAVGTLYLILAGMVSFTLLLSAKMRSSVPVLVIIVFAFMLPMFIGISETNGIWNRIFVLLPYRAAQSVFSDDFYGYFGYPVGGLTFDVVTVRMLLYAAVTLIYVPFARKAWKGHQVV